MLLLSLEAARGTRVNVNDGVSKSGNKSTYDVEPEGEKYRVDASISELYYISGVSHPDQ